MRVANIECQIAQGQIGRYLLGEGFSAEAIRQLEEHVASCPDCKQVLQARRAALQSMLGGEPPAAAATYPAEEATSGERAEDQAPNPLMEILRQRTLGLAGRGAATAAVMAPADAPREAAQLEPAPGQAAYWKPLVYSGALALVLILMSYMSKAPAALLGEKVLPAGAAVETQTEATTPTPVSGTPPESADPPVAAADFEDEGLAEEPVVSDDAPVPRSSGSRTRADEAARPSEPKAKPQRQQTQRQQSQRPAASRPQAPRQTERPAAKRQAPPEDTIRVYAPDGG